MSKAIDTYLGKKVAQDAAEANAIAEAKSKVNDAYIALGKAEDIIYRAGGNIKDTGIEGRIRTTRTIVNDLWKEMGRLFGEFSRIGR